MNVYELFQFCSNDQTMDKAVRLMSGKKQINNICKKRIMIVLPSINDFIFCDLHQAIHSLICKEAWKDRHRLPVDSQDVCSHP